MKELLEFIFAALLSLICTPIVVAIIAVVLSMVLLISPIVIFLSLWILIYVEIEKILLE